MKGKIFMGALASLSLFLIFSACDIGLGGAVDTEAPSGSITTPPVNAVIRDAFAIKGSCNDDGKISSVKVTLQNTDTKSSKTYSGTVEQSSWSCVIPKELIDGTYVATVSLNDDGGHSTVLTRSYIIDNTPPVIVLQRPGSRIDATDAEADAYGQTFTLEGQAADNNNIDRIDVSVYETSDLSGDPLKTITLNNVPSSINLNVAKFELDVSNDYSDIYGATGLQGSKTRYCKIYSYDGAQRYPADGSNQSATDTLGNVQTNYYLYDEVSAKILKFYKINELYNMFNGTYSSGNIQSANQTVSEVKEFLQEKAISSSKFILNPESNPTFATNNVNQLENPVGGTEFGSGSYDIPNKTSLTITVSPSLDNTNLPVVVDGECKTQLSTPLSDGSTEISLKAYVYDWATKQEDSTKANRIYLTKEMGGEWKKEGSKRVFSIPLERDTLNRVSGSNKFIIGHIYVIGIEGRDENGFEVTKSGNGYAFRYSGSSFAPNVSLTIKVNGAAQEDKATYYVPKNNPSSTATTPTEIEFSGTVEISDGEQLEIESYKDKILLSFDNNDIYIPVTPVSGSDTKFTFSKAITTSEFNPNDKNGQHTISLKAAAALSTEVIKYFMLDVEPPTISDITVSPLAKNYYDSTGKLIESGTPSDSKSLNGTVYVKYSISDNNSIEKTGTKIEFIQDGSVKKSVPFDSDTELNGTYTLSTTSAANNIEDNKDLVIRVTAKDNAGNIASRDFTYKVNQNTDKPVVLPNNSANLSLLITDKNTILSAEPQKNVFSRSGTLTLKLIDDDGLLKVQPWLGTSATEACTQNDLGSTEQLSSFTNPTSISSSPTDYTYEYTLPDKPGYWFVKFTVTDVNQTSYTSPAFAIYVSAGKPQIESLETAVTDASGNVKAGRTYINGKDEYSFKNTLTFSSSYTKFRIYRKIASATDFTEIADFVRDGDSWTETLNLDGIDSSLITNADGNLVFEDKNLKPAIDESEDKVAVLYTYCIAGLEGEEANLKEIRSADAKVTCYGDAKAPTVSIKSIPGKEDTLGTNASFDFSGRASDTGESTGLTGSGVAKVEFTITDDADPSKTKTVTINDASWSKTIKFADSNDEFKNVFASEGKKNITVKAYDEAGNVSAPLERDFVYDKENPVLTFSTAAIKNYIKADGIEITDGSVSDSYKLGSLTVVETLDGEATSNSPKTITFGSDSKSGSWTLKLPLSLNAETPGTPAQGKYTYQFVLTDSVGHEAKLPATGAYNVTLDTTSPVISGIKVMNEAFTVGTTADTLNIYSSPTSKWSDSRSVSVQVSIDESESGSGIDSVIYFIPTETKTQPEDSDWDDNRLNPTNDGSYRGTVSLSSEGQAQSFCILAKDYAGNLSVKKTVKVNIDTSAPELAVSKVKIGDAEAKISSGTEYINDTADITVYGEYYDTLSGIQNLTFTGTKDNEKPEITYATSGASTESASYNISELNDSNRSQIKYWKAVFANAKLTTGTIKVSGKNTAGTNGIETVSKTLFTLYKDTNPPTLGDVSILSNNENYNVYKSPSEANTYYINNTAGTFTISVPATDVIKTYIPEGATEAVKVEGESVSSVANVKLTIEGLAADKQPEPSASGYFGEVDLRDFTENQATVTLVAIDNAGNKSAEKTFTLKFDTKSPAGVHAFDASGKDLYFRIGKQNREEEEGAATTASETTWTPAWNKNKAGQAVTDSADSTKVIAIDEDVGGKYSSDTYGNSETIDIRGTFDDANGSGISMIYYKVYTSQPDNASDTTSPKTSDFLANYKELADGSFTQIKATSDKTVEQQAVRRVFYKNKAGLKNSLGNDIIADGSITYSKDGESITKSYVNIASTYKTTISGLTVNAANYLALVVVDNVGNAVVEKVKLDDGSEYSNYIINVDKTAPVLTAAQSSDIIYLQRSGKTSLNGTVTDLGETNAGIRKVEVYAKVNGVEKTFPVTLKKGTTVINGSSPRSDKRDLTWSAVVDASKLGNSGNNPVSVRAIDDAGNGNSDSMPAATIIMDENAPTVTNVAVSSGVTEKHKETGETGEGTTQVNNTITISGEAKDDKALYEEKYEKNEDGTDKTDSDGNKIKTRSLVLYYTTSSSVGANKPVAGENSTIGENAASKWVLLDAIEHGATWSFSVDTTQFNDKSYVWFSVAAKDKAENVGYSQPTKVYVNQDTDRPVIELLNLNFADKDSDKNYLKGTSTSTTSLTISVTDDDGVDTIKYSLNGTATNPSWAPYSRGISGLSEGENTVYFQIKDKAGKTFTTAATDTEKTIGTTNYNISNQPVITGTRVSKDLNGNEVVKTVSTGTVQLDFNVVTLKPEISEIKYSYYNSKTNAWSDFDESLRTMGGIYTKLKIQLKASSAQNIKEVKATYSGDTRVNNVLPSYDFTCADESWNDANAHVWTSEEITIGSVTREQEIIVIAYDKVPDPMTDERSLSVKIDNTAPGLDIQSPSGTTELSLEQTVRGTIRETSTLYYAVSRVESSEEEIDTVTPNSEEEALKASDGKTLATKWTQIEDDTSSGTWYVYFDETDPNNSEAHAPKFSTYLTENYLGITTKADITKKDNPYTTLTPIYFWIKAVDDCGNESIAHRRFTIDPQGENPTVEITDPTNDDDGNPPTLGGSIKIKGSADDHNEPKYVWVQIDSDETAGFKLEDLETIFNVKDKDEKRVYKLGKITENKEITSLSGITDNTASDYGIMIELAGSGTSKRWTLSINDNNEFDPTGTSGKRTINITVLATDQDADGTIHVSPAKTQTVIIDANNPYFDEDSLKLVKYAANGAVQAEQSYSSGINVKGIWYLTGKLKDADSGIKEIKYKGTMVVSVSGEDYTDPEDTNLWFKHVLEDGTKTKSDGTKEKVNNYEFSIPLGNSTTGEVGTDEAIIHIVENTDTGLWADKTFSVNFDNKAPELKTKTSDSTFVKLDSQVQNSSGFYTFGAVATEDNVKVNGKEISQTGVERIAFYFTRDLDYSLKVKYPETYKKHGDENTNDLFDVMIYHSNKEDDTEDDDVESGNMIVNYKGANSGLTKEDGLYWKTINGTIESNTTFTYSGDTDPNIHKRGLVKINNVIYLITAVNDKTLTIDGNFTNGPIEAEFAVCNVIDYSGEKNSGSISLNKGYGYGYYPSRDSDDGDLITETFNSQGTEWIFDAAINSKNLPDGPITLHIVAFDKAGNASTEWKSTNFVVSNNAPRIAGMRIGTDENGNGIVDESEFNTTYSGKYELGYENGDSERPVTEVEFPIQTTSTPKVLLTIKGRTILKPEIVGGNGTISYVYGIQTYSNSSWGTEKSIITDKVNLGTGTTDAVAELDDIDLTLDHFIGTTNDADTEEIPDGINRFIFSFGDSTPGQSSTDSISNNAKLKVIMNVALRETNKAENYILPFYWNTDDDNSLFKQSKEQGHIELAKDWILASGYDESASTGEMDADPKVSGKIKIEGIAKDDTLLNQIIVKLNKKLGDNEELAIASYDSGNQLIPATWAVTQLESDGSIGSAGWASEIRNATYSDLMKTGIITEYPVVGGVTKKAADEVPYTSQEYGHVVHWILYLDTEKFDGIATTDVTVTATANDRGSPKWSDSDNAAVFTPNAAAVTGTGYSGAVTKNGTSVTEGALTGSYKMDVVPYISKISTRLDDAYSAVTSVFNRSANGNYPVMRGETGFKLYGFNLKGADTTVKFNGTSVGTVTAGTTSDYVTFTVPAAAKSGAVDITVSSVASLNNSNSATAEYNHEPNGINNDTLNDNRSVYVWGMNDVVDGVKTVRYPSFKIGKDSNQTYAFVYDYDGQRIRYNLNGTDSKLDRSYSQWYATACAVDTSGNLYGGAQNGDTGGSGGNGYANYKFYAFANSYTAGYNYDGVTGAYNSGGSSIRLENTVYNNTFYAERVQNPKIVTFGSNTTSIYTVYYDSAKGGIIFRYGTAKKGNGATTFGGGIVDYFTNENNNTSNARVIDNSENIGEYAAVGVIPNGLVGQIGGTAVVCWNADNKLKFKYNTNPTGDTWSETIVLDSDYAGEYCNLAVDAAGGIHIAYYRAGNKLKYAYLESYTDTTPDICMVDSYLSVGENISIETSSKTISYTEGGVEKTRYVPYISYYSNAIGMAKVAWPVKLGKNGTTENTFVNGVNNDKFTGNWEVQVLPTALATNLLNYSIGVGEKSNGTANSVMLGYGTKTGLQTALLY